MMDILIKFRDGSKDCIMKDIDDWGRADNDSNYYVRKGLWTSFIPVDAVKFIGPCGYIEEVN